MRVILAAAWLAAASLAGAQVAGAEARRAASPLLLPRSAPLSEPWMADAVGDSTGTPRTDEPEAREALVAHSPTGERVRAWQTGMLRPDRIQHLSLSLASGAACGVVTREPVIAAGAAMTLGILKEIRDTRHGGFDWLDLAADAIGAAGAVLLTTDLVR